VLFVPSLWSGSAMDLVVIEKCVLRASHGCGSYLMISTVASASNFVPQYMLQRFVHLLH
jgi:hypothetical protein